MGMIVRVCCVSVFFFFSSRRRHTRCSRDWSSDVCSSDLVVPDRITPAKFKPNKPRPNLTVYRLEGVGVDSAAVIAKRCTQGGGQIERTVYERILPHVPLAGPRYYGTVSGSHEDHAEDVCWLFIGE